MPTAKYSDQEFANIWRVAAGGSPTEVSRITGYPASMVYRRRKNLAEKGVYLATVSRKESSNGANGRNNESWQTAHAYTPRINAEFRNAVVLVGSDQHYWPGIVTLAHKSFVALAREMKPAAVILNGDVFDGARVSRHDPMGWQKLPDVREELEAVRERLLEIQLAAGKAQRFWTVGNHDSRFDRRLAMHAAEFDGVAGFSLADQFREWQMSYSVMINAELGEPVMVRHAMRGGIHAIYNNTLHAGVSIVTGHLHAQLVRPFTDYRGTRYGVDCGTMAAIDGPQFSYTMDGPVNWRSGFVVLTFDKEGRLMPPELVEIQHVGKTKRAVFRGRIIASESMDAVASKNSRASTKGHSRDVEVPIRNRDGNRISSKNTRRRIRNAGRARQEARA